MPRYFFDITVSNANRIEDHEGVELRDAQRAREHAIGKVRGLFSKSILDLLEPEDGYIEVRNEASRLLFRVPFEEAYRNGDECGSG